MTDEKQQIETALPEGRDVAVSVQEIQDLLLLKRYLRHYEKWMGACNGSHLNLQIGNAQMVTVDYSGDPIKALLECFRQAEQEVKHE